MVNRLAITNMAKYVATRAVLLPGDMEHGSTVQHGLSEQLRSILGHIEDMEVVKERVTKSDLTPGYMEPLASDKSDIRIDYWVLYVYANNFYVYMQIKEWVSFIFKQQFGTVHEDIVH